MRLLMVAAARAGTRAGPLGHQGRLGLQVIATEQPAMMIGNAAQDITLAFCDQAVRLRYPPSLRDVVDTAFGPLRSEAARATPRGCRHRRW
jgi:hypothetical protein